MIPVQWLIQFKNHIAKNFYVFTDVYLLEHEWLLYTYLITQITLIV